MSRTVRRVWNIAYWRGELDPGPRFVTVPDGRFPHLPASAGMRREKRNALRSHRRHNRQRVARGLDPIRYDRAWLD